MTKMIFIGLCTFFLTTFVTASGQNVNQHIRKGNNWYNEGDFTEAELEYRRALESDSQNLPALFNLGNALYQQGRYEEAAELFDAIAQTAPDGFDKAGTYHNLGNSLLGTQKFAESIEAYKRALRLNPDDNDTRYNLAYAMQMLQDPPPQEDQQDGEDEQEDEEEKNDEQQQGQDQQDQHEQQQEQARQDQLTQQDAERILDALNQEENKVQRDVQQHEMQQQATRAEKEW